MQKYLFLFALEYSEKQAFFKLIFYFCLFALVVQVLSQVKQNDLYDSSSPTLNSYEFSSNICSEFGHTFILLLL